MHTTANASRTDCYARKNRDVSPAPPKPSQPNRNRPSAGRQRTSQNPRNPKNDRRKTACRVWAFVGPAAYRLVQSPATLHAPISPLTRTKTGFFLLFLSFIAVAFRGATNNRGSKLPIYSASKDSHFRHGNDEGASQKVDRSSLFWSLLRTGRSAKYSNLFGEQQAVNAGYKSKWPRWWRRNSQERCGQDRWDEQIKTVEGMVGRQVPEIVGRVAFSRSITCKGSGGCFEVSLEGDTLCVRGSSGVELASGLYWFLKEHCDGTIAWDKTGGKQINDRCLTPSHLTSLRTKLPIHKTRPIPLNYYQNVVTSSYSMAFWNWKRWEREIDWMALHGVNLPLALAGQEYILTQVFGELGLTFEDLRDFFAGPAFLSWGRMGNLQGYAGPLPWSYVRKQADLQRLIVNRMRRFGMTPVFPGFAGFVPNALLDMFPEVNAVKSSNWCNLPDENSCVWLLNPDDPLFTRIGSAFVRTLRAEFGDDPVGFYAVDVFNEMAPTSSDPAYLQYVSAAVYGALKQGDPSAVWLMQSWMFYSNLDFWKPEQIQAVLNGVPDGNLLLLDLYAERYPQWKRTESFYGRPFIWCMLHNFGGNHDMHGHAVEVAQGPPEALATESSIVGVGMCPEGIEHNPVMFELMSDMAFRQDAPALVNWFEDYSVQRYGGRVCPEAIQAWQVLRSTVYAGTLDRHETVMDVPSSRPGKDPREVFWGLKPQIWYDPVKVVDAWDLLLQCSDTLGSVSSFQYDLVDVGRQVLSKVSTKHWKAVVFAYLQKDLQELEATGTSLLSLLSDLDELLSTHAGFLLGPWLESAKNAGESPEEMKLMEWNARLQITLWGTSPTGDTELSDYANKHWAGLMHSFYRERWRMWLERLRTDLIEGRNYNVKEWTEEVVEFTEQWTRGLELFPLDPHGSAVEVSKRLYAKYSREARIIDV